VRYSSSCLTNDLEFVEKNSLISVIYLILAIALASCAEPEVFEFEDQTVRPARIFKVQSDLDTVTRRFVGKVDASQTVDM
jgi:hypothetical protein